MVDVLEVGPADVEAVVVSWLQPLRRAAAVRRNDDPLPMTVVHHVDGSESVDEGTVDMVVSVHTLCARADGETAAAAQADRTHRRMLALARELDVVTLPSGLTVGVDYVTVDEPPRWVPFSDQILRKVGRYLIGLTYQDSPNPEPGS